MEKDAFLLVTAICTRADLAVCRRASAIASAKCPPATRRAERAPQVAYRRGGPEALNDRSTRPDRVWNRIPEGVRDNLIQLMLDEAALSQGDRLGLVLPVNRVRRLLALYCGVEVVHRHAGGDVTNTLDLALRSSSLIRPSQPIDHGCCPTMVPAISRRGDLAKWLNDRNIKHLRGAPYHPMTQGKNRALASDPQELHPVGKLLPARRSLRSDCGIHRRLQPPPIPREHQQFHPRRRLLRVPPGDPCRTTKDQTTDHLPTVDCSTTCRPPDLIYPVRFTQKI